MKTLKKLWYYFNPFNRLGKKQYSVVLPFLVTVISAVLLEFYVYEILKQPELVRVPALIIFLWLIIYFASRDGLRGGFTATGVTILYYFYIIISRPTTENQFIIDIETTIILGFLYIFLSSIIGGLKQKTDTLLEREADEKKHLQAILQQMHVGVVVTDKDGKVTHVNKQLESILGFKVPIGSIVGKNVVIVPVKYRQKPVVHVLKTGKAIMGKDYVIDKKYGKKTYIQLNAAPIYNKHHQIVSIIATVTDISQQKELEKKKDDFVNIASHELKTPITSMKLYMDSLSSRIAKYKDAQLAKIIRSIQYQNNQLEELVNELLDVSRLQTGKMAFTKEPFLLNDLLKETLESLKVITKNQHIIFLEEKPLDVFADKFRIHQVITNLITNAVKYSPAGTDILVRLKKTGEKAIVSVKDSGIGISKEEQKKIFNRLYQVTDRKGKTFPGLGIGLYISKQIIRRHKGILWVESEKGKGSTFFFSLPLLKKNTNYDKKT